MRPSLVLAVVALAAALAAALPGSAAPAHASYTDEAFARPLDAGLRAFYRRDFSAASEAFATALAAAPDNTLAIAFLNATAAQTPGG